MLQIWTSASTRMSFDKVLLWATFFGCFCGISSFDPIPHYPEGWLVDLGESGYTYSSLPVLCIKQIKCIKPTGGSGDDELNVWIGNNKIWNKPRENVNKDWSAPPADLSADHWVKFAYGFRWYEIITITLKEIDCAFFCDDDMIGKSVRGMRQNSVFTMTGPV